MSITITERHISADKHDGLGCYYCGHPEYRKEIDNDRTIAWLVCEKCERAISHGKPNWTTAQFFKQIAIDTNKKMQAYDAIQNIRRRG